MQHNGSLHMWCGLQNSGLYGRKQLSLEQTAYVFVTKAMPKYSMFVNISPCFTHKQLLCIMKENINPAIHAYTRTCFLLLFNCCLLVNNAMCESTFLWITHIHLLPR